MVHFSHLLKHTAAVPKGFLRHYVLKLLSEKPMSGSEIMSGVEKRSFRGWKSSPGSIYPLLSWLQENEYTKEQTEQTPGIKRYILTDKGKEFLKEHEKRKEELRERFQLCTPTFFGPFMFNYHQKEARELVRAERELIMTTSKLLELSRDNNSKEVLDKAVEVLNEAIKKMTNINLE
jgi:DNA-binding PadR family transcriptional regulator